jgi:WD40 repeat protein/tRNA A-37 threonylcarbamoyl transferase component Bud32
VGIDCPPEEDLRAFHLGTLPEDRIEVVAAHLEACAPCAAAVERLDAAPDPVLAALRQSLPPTLTPLRATVGPASLPDPVDCPLLPGYEVLAPLGRGGMGVVHKARQVRLNRLVALKQLRAGDARELARARIEAEALARLQHPHVVQIHEVLEHDGRVYLALELVEGGSLGGRLAGKPQPPREAAALVQTLARTTHHAHGQGIIHRDLKPANVLLTPDGAPKIADFGLARLHAGGARETREGDVMGTPAYMAPEQATGRVEGVGPAADVYSLGVILYEMLTGRVPFQGVGVLDTLLLAGTQEPVPPRRLQPRVPRDLETICLKCLQKEPPKRYASAGALADDLGRFLAGEPVRARPTTPWERAWKWARRRPAVAGLSAAVVAVALAGLVLVGWQWRQAEGRRRRAEEAEARLALRQGQALCEQGDVGRGLLWLARSLERATSAGAADLDRPLRVNLAEWGRMLRPQRAPLPNDASVLWVAFDPTGRTLLAACKDGRVHFWDVEEGREVGPALEVPRLWPVSWVGVVEFSPDGRTIATAGGDYAALWDAATHRPLGAPLDHTPGMLWGMAFFPDGKRLATCRDDGTARVWDLATRKVVLGPLRHGGPPGYYTLALSPDGQTLITAGDGGRVVRWQVASGQPILPDLHHDSTVLSAAFSPDGRKLLTSTRAGTLHVWDLATARANDLPRQGMESSGVAMAPDGRWFATANSFGIVRLWQADALRTIGPTYRCPGKVATLAFSPDGRRLAMGMEAGGIAVADLPPSPEPVAPAALSAGIHTVAYSRDGRRLLAGTQAGAAWLDGPTNKPVGGVLSTPEHYLTVSAALGPDGTTLATGRWAGKKGGWKGRADLWDAASGQRRWQTADLPAPVHLLLYSPDGRTLFAGGGWPAGAGAGLWDTATGTCLRPLLASLGRTLVHRAAFLPDGRRLVLACDDGRVRLWDAEADAEIDPDRPLVHAGAVTAVACDGAGERVLAGCRDGTARLWDLRTRLPLFPPMRQEAQVSTVAFSPDGRTLLTGSADGAARFWDAASGQMLGPTRWARGALHGVAYHPDGGRIAGGGETATVYQWHVPAPPLEGSPERIRLWAEGLSGLALEEDGAVSELSPAEVSERRRLGDLGPTADPGR